MSLVKKQSMTERKLAAQRRNARLSHGPVTPEGLERIRAAQLRHGFYAQSEEAALRILGEDPAELHDLREGLLRKWKPADVLQERLVARLARAEWRADRAYRMQEGHAIRQAKVLNETREGRLHSHLMRLKMSSESLQVLAQSVAQEYYVTTPADLKLINSLQKEGVVKEMGEVVLALFYQLREPGAPGPGEPVEDEDEKAKTHRVMNKIRAIFGLAALPENEEEAGEGAAESGDAGAGVAPDVAPDFIPAPSDLQAGAAQEADPADPQPDSPQISSPESHVPPCGPVPSGGGPCADARGLYPKITQEEWEARETARQLLENLLTRQVQLYDEQRQEILREILEGPSPYERAAEIAPTQPNALFMQRMEDSNLRQVSRMTYLLLKLKRHDRQREAFEGAAGSQDVEEKERA